MYLKVGMLQSYSKILTNCRHDKFLMKIYYKYEKFIIVLIHFGDETATLKTNLVGPIFGFGFLFALGNDSFQKAFLINTIYNKKVCKKIF